MKTTLAGYQIADILYDGTRTQVYRGVKTDDSKPVVLKKLRKEYPTFNDLLQFRHQYVLTKNLDLRGIVKPIALEKDGNGYVLVMEDVGGVSLSEYIRDRSLSIQDFLEIAIALSQILENLYRNRVIHKDIKPANILINPETKEIYLIDFSISSLLPRETQEIQNPNVLEGTLAYISPEQTGRMNRGIDYRSDFYSLGVTFYQLLTGKLPFKSDDPMELVYCHIAKTPIPLHEVEPEIPVTLSALVMKLMAKTVEERYQGAKGIKYDLDKCWQQWQETGSITEFDLGERDISDRFLIPEKLYGRETDVQSLLDAFERVASGQTEMMLVAGFSGIGKTAVVNEVHKPIVQARGYFIKGKFDQFQRNIPFSALVQAFRDLMGQLLSESDAQLEMWKTTILNALGENAQAIINVIPELEGIIGKQPPVPELSGSAAQNRFNLLFQKFIRVFTTPDHPLVIFVDDLQWADSASLKLMKLLMGDANTGYLLFLGAYRDNEVFPTHPLMLSLDEIANSGATLNTITLNPLSLVDLNRLVADTLCCNLELALPLTELVYQKTKGNPFFATQFLKFLHEDGWIEFNFDVGHWQCNMTRVQELSLTDNVVEFMATRLHKLGAKTQEMLKLAACIGDRFDLNTLAIVSEQSFVEVAESLWGALQEGLVLPLDQTYKFFQEANRIAPQKVEKASVSYKFLHDRVQQAAYLLIPEAEKQGTHLKIGKLLLTHTPVEKQEENLFDIVNQLNAGLELIEESDFREELARLNLKAGKKAKSATAYEGAVKYLTVGRELLALDSWQSQYHLALSLHEEAAEAAYLSGDFEQMEKLISLVQESAQSLLDRVKVYELQILTCMSQKRLSAAVEMAIEVLKLLEVSFPDSPKPSDLNEAYEETKANLAGKSIEDLFDLPEMTESLPLAASRILWRVIPVAYIVVPQVCQLMILKMVNLSLTYGNTSVSAFAYSTYGMLLNPIQEDFDLGHRVGELAFKLASNPKAQEVKAITIYVINSFIKHWTCHVRETLQPFLDCYASGLETGDMQHAAFALYRYCHHSLYLGKNLQQVEQEIRTYNEAIAQTKHRTSMPWNDTFRQLALNLMGESPKNSDLIGAACDREEMLEIYRQQNDRIGIHYLYISQLILYYLFEEVERAAEYADLAEEYLDTVIASLGFPVFYFYDSLARISVFGQVDSDQKTEILNKVKSSQEKMELWAKSAPTNFKHKYELVEAERYRVLGQRPKAIELYDRAIAGAKENEYLQEEALANELAAKFYLEWNKEKVAAGYMQEAYYCYACWGAKAKVEDLEKRYSTLLSPILEGQKLTLTPSAMIAGMTTGTASKSTTGTGDFLDLATLMKASRTLSENIELEGAIANLMQVAMENAGAETAALMLFEEEVLMLSALVHGEEAPQIDPIPVESSNGVPKSIVNQVKRTQKPIALDNASNETAYAGDAYIQQYQPKSILCLPLIASGKLIGILYLENNQVAGGFTSDRVEILTLLCSQAAISLENARLYRKSQNYSQKLEHTQLQLVQSEKMATVGELTAGVAHEINNPVGFISGNLDYASEYIENLDELLQLYQQGFAYDSETIQEKIEDIELDYLLEDFRGLIFSMKEGTNRIVEISKSMRTFSRADTTAKVAFNIHEGINSTLLILKHRLKGNESRPEIEIVKNYGDLQEVNCYPGQLNQVFMNLIANAIDAFDESNVGRTFAEIKEAPNRIAITTDVDSEKEVAIVKIKDNGIGMSEEVKAKIFEHLFTTKGVGKGTGLGLSISRQIVEEKHGGKITLTSEVGKGTEFAITLPLT